MPSPFPGMDPYLEDPALWPDVHSRLITVLSDLLTAQVAPQFVVRIEQSVYITADDDPLTRQQIAPDLYLVRGPQAGESSSTKSAITAPTLAEPLNPIEIRDRYLEIHDARSRAVIATLEILSPITKAAGTPGRDAFLRKRRAVMASPAHWIEIDLLRAGERPAEIAGRSDYYALLKRGNTFGPFELWYANLHDSLPTIGIPLRPPFSDVPLNLQEALDTVYARARYGDDVDYARPVPAPALLPADRAWVTGRVQAWHTNSPDAAR